MMVQFQILFALLGLRAVNPSHDCASPTDKALLPARAAFSTAPSRTALALLKRQTHPTAVGQCISAGTTYRALRCSLQSGAKARPSLNACSLTNDTSLMTGFQFLHQLMTFQKHSNLLRGRERDSAGDLSTQNLCVFLFKAALKCCFPREENS